MRPLQLFLFLGLLGCGKPAPLRLEVAREWTEEGGEAFIYCHVDRMDLERAGVSGTTVRDFVLGYSATFSRGLVSIGVDQWFGSEAEGSEHLRLDLPPWIPEVFPEGMDIEIVEIDSSGDRKTTRNRVPIRAPPRK